MIYNCRGLDNQLVMLQWMGMSRRWNFRQDLMWNGLQPNVGKVELNTLGESNTKTWLDIRSRKGLPYPIN